MKTASDFPMLIEWLSKILARKLTRTEDANHAIEVWTTPNDRALLIVLTETTWSLFTDYPKAMPRWRFADAEMRLGI